MEREELLKKVIAKIEKMDQEELEKIAADLEKVKLNKLSLNTGYKI